MSEQSRREILRNIAFGATLAAMPAADAQHVHQEVSDAKARTGGTYKPKLFNEHEYATVKLLSETIIPADEVSGSAVEAGAPEFIDLIGSSNEDMATLLTGGLAWLDREMERRAGKDFLSAAGGERTALLDQIAFKKNATPELRPGIAFFDQFRRLVADAFYTSPIGVKDVGYVGNKGMTKFEVPASAIAYAVKRSGL